MTDFETRVSDAKRAIRGASVDGIQRRTVPFTFEVRAKDDGTYAIAGHAAVFNDLSENLGGFREKIDPGAFSKVLESKPDVRALFNHDPNLVLARTTNDTLRLSEDKTGLLYEADVAPTTYGNDLRVLLERRDVSQSSFAFRVSGDGQSWDEDEETGALIRTIHEFSGLYDVSPVTYPAYTTTDADTHNLETSPDDERESEHEAETADSMAEAGQADGSGEWRKADVARRMKRLEVEGLVPTDR